MKEANHRAKIAAMIEQEAQQVQTEDLVSYLNAVITEVSLLHRVASSRTWETLPPARIIEMINAMGSALVWSRDVLREVQQWLASPEESA